MKANKYIFIFIILMFLISLSVLYIKTNKEINRLKYENNELLNYKNSRINTIDSLYNVINNSEKEIEVITNTKTIIKKIYENKINYLDSTDIDSNIIFFTNYIEQFKENR